MLPLGKDCGGDSTGPPMHIRQHLPARREGIVVRYRILVRFKRSISVAFVTKAMPALLISETIGWIYCDESVIDRNGLIEFLFKPVGDGKRVKCILVVRFIGQQLFTKFDRP